MGFGVLAGTCTAHHVTTSIFGMPDIDPRFLALDNVVLQPHSASITHETRAAMVARLLGDIDAFINGKPFYDAAAK